MGDRKAWRENHFFSFSTFCFSLADSVKLMKEQYDHLLFCYFMLSTVLSGLGRYGAGG